MNWSKSLQTVRLWEAAETENRVAVPDRGRQRALLAQPLIELQPAVLICGVLAVLEGEVEEHPERRADALVVAPVQRDAGDLTRLGVGGEGARRAAEDVAGKLVERQHQREALLTRLDEAIESPARSPLVEFGVTLTQRGVELGRGTEPHLSPLHHGGEAGGAKPECKNVFRDQVHGIGEDPLGILRLALSRY